MAGFSIRTFSRQLGSLSLFGVAGIRFIYSGKAVRRPGVITSVLVVAAGKLGDVVCTTPVLSALRAHLPAAKIIVEDNRGINQQLLEDSGLVDEYITMRHFFRTVAILHRKHIDVACITGPNFFLAACLYIAGVPLIVTPRIVGGYSPVETRLYRVLTRWMSTVSCRMGQYAPLERLRVLEPLGIVESDTTKHLGLSQTAVDWVEELLIASNINPGERFICITPGAGNKVKQWPPERFSHIADHIFSLYKIPIVVIGTRVDRAEVEQMCVHTSANTQLVNLSEKLSLRELKALISKAYLFIGVDTGPLYIAEAFGIPTVDITGPIDEREQPPIGPRNRVVVPQNRQGPQLFVMNARVYDVQEARRQAESITVGQVISETEDLLRSLNGA